MLPSSRRRDGRLAGQLRPLSAEFGVLPSSDGSARLSQGDTSVLVSVFGPRPARSLRHEDPHGSTLEVVVLPPSGAAGKAEADAERALHDVFAAAILASAHPRAVVSVNVQVIHDGGSLLATVVNAVTLALADAGVPLLGLVAAVSCGLAAGGGSGGGGGGSSSGAGIGDGAGGSSSSDSDCRVTGEEEHGGEPMFDLLRGEEDACRAAGIYAFCGGGAVLVRQGGAGSWDEARRLLEGAAAASATVLAFLRLALQRKVERDNCGGMPSG